MRVFNRGSGEPGDEERGRSRLSVIKELDEVIIQRECKKNRLSALVTRVDLSASVADFQWWWARSNLNPWKLKRPADDPSSGIIIIMTEVEVTRGKIEICPTPPRIPCVNSVPDGGRIGGQMS